MRKWGVRQQSARALGDGMQLSRIVIKNYRSLKFIDVLLSDAIQSTLLDAA
jgi:hypothetical protein